MVGKALVGLLYLGLRNGLRDVGHLRLRDRLRNRLRHKVANWVRNRQLLNGELRRVVPNYEHVEYVHQFRHQVLHVQRQRRPLHDGILRVNCNTCRDRVDGLLDLGC